MRNHFVSAHIGMEFQHPLSSLTLITTHNSLTCVDSSAPQNVQVKAISSSSVRVTWDPPTEPQGIIVGYAVTWYRNGTYKYRFRATSPNFAEIVYLRSGDTISVIVCALYRSEDPKTGEYRGTDSKVATVTIPHSNEG